jgi:hypothetical protein
MLKIFVSLPKLKNLNMKNLRKILVIIIVIYLSFLFDFTVSYSNDKKEYKMEYEGLLWVGLDYWTIKKYNSNDTPMKWLNFTVSDINKNKK